MKPKSSSYIVQTSTFPKLPLRWEFSENIRRESRLLSFCNVCFSIHQSHQLCCFYQYIFQLDEEEASDVTVLEYKPRKQIAIKFSKNLIAGQKCTLNLEYSASLSNTYDGLYNSSYIDKDGTKRYSLRHMRRSKHHVWKSKQIFQSLNCSVQSNTIRINKSSHGWFSVIIVAYGHTGYWTVMHCYHTSKVVDHSLP